MIRKTFNRKRRKSKKELIDKLKKQDEERYEFEEETIRELNKQLESFR